MNFVILCGGSGSRLWPKSREKMPKQFLKLNNQYTMLQNTILRIINLIDFLPEKFNTKIIVICNKDHYFIVEKQFEELDINIEFFIVTEPKGRDSAPAICIASLLGDADENTFIMPCDHIFDNSEFIISTMKAINYLDDSIVTFGIKADKPETGYGYIKIGANNITEKFVEKPNAEVASEYISSGNYSWNAGIFMFKNKNMIESFIKYAPDIFNNCKETIENTYKNLDLKEKIINLSPYPFTTCTAISIDYAIMEKLIDDNDKNINGITILYNGHWNDIGSYLALYNEMGKNNDNNVIINNNVITLNTKNSYIESEDSFCAVIGVNNLTVVNTKDSLLICNNDNCQDVKKVVEYLKNNNMEEAYYHKKVFRPWGYYINVEGHDTNGFKMKRIAVYPGKRLSLQSHNYRSEHWVIVKGTAKVQVGTENFIMSQDQHVYIPIKTLHRIENIGDELMEFTETQIGDYLGEDDIIRYEDDFNRT
jgi:mannose-1-phosphate guanylyltransferase/mannose-6-phosphate isomerase